MNSKTLLARGHNTIHSGLAGPLDLADAIGSFKLTSAEEDIRTTEGSAEFRLVRWD